VLVVLQAVQVVAAPIPGQVLAVVGRTPAFFLVNVVGGLLGTDRFAAALALAVVLAVISVLGYLYRDPLVRFFGGDP